MYLHMEFIIVPRKHLTSLTTKITLIQKSDPDKHCSFSINHTNQKGIHITQSFLK